MQETRSLMPPWPCFLHWQGHNSSCQWSPIGPPLFPLVMESGGNTPPPLIPPQEMWQPSGLLGNAVLCEWQMQGSSTGSMSSNVTWVSHPPTLTRIFPHLFSPHLSLHHCLVPLLSPPSQGSEKSWSDYRWTAEEDREQPQSPRFPHQERPGTCLRQMNPEDWEHKRPVCQRGCYSQSNTVASYLNRKWMEKYDSNEGFHCFLWEMISRPDRWRAQCGAASWLFSPPSLHAQVEMPYRQIRG